MENTRFHNQLEILNPEEIKNKSVLIIGAGGIGSSSAYALAQMGVSNITVIDYDEVENHNIASQFYKESQLGKNKIQSLQENIKEFTGVTINIIDRKFEPDDVKGKSIVIMGVDNMATRKQIAESCEMPIERVIDCRMKGEFFQIYMFIPGLELDWYMTKWYSDNEADPTKCTVKAVSYNCLAIASIIARLVSGIFKKEKDILNRREIDVDLHNLLIS